MKTPYLAGMHKVATQVKEAFKLSPFQTGRDGTISMHPGVGLAFGGAFVLGLTLKKIQNSIRHKAIVEDLMTTDPIIKQAPREQVLEAYATIYNLAPRIALEKQIVRELLQHVVKFGRLDMQTVKMITDTEKTIKDVRMLSFPSLPKLG